MVEAYHPERVLRQFGILQRIPGPPLLPAHVSRLRTGAGYKVKFSQYAQSLWDRAHDHLLRDRTHLVTRPGDTVEGYLEWFRLVSHPIVQPPHRRSSHEVNVPQFDYAGYDDLNMVSYIFF